jgi:hypothetical protein
MNKMNLTLVSLVGAIPAAGLAVVLVMSFLSYADKMSGTLKGLAGGTLALVAVMLLMPAAILVFGAKTKKAGDAVEPAAEAKEEAVVEEAEVAEEGAEAEAIDEGEAVAEGEIVEEGEAVEIAEDFGEAESVADAEVVEETPSEDEFVFDEEVADEDEKKS